MFGRNIQVNVFRVDHLPITQAVQATVSVTDVDTGKMVMKTEKADQVSQSGIYYILLLISYSNHKIYKLHIL